MTNSLKCNKPEDFITGEIMDSFDVVAATMY